MQRKGQRIINFNNNIDIYIERPFYNTVPSLVMRHSTEAKQVAVPSPSFLVVVVAALVVVVAALVVVF